MEFSAVVYQLFSPMKGTSAGILNQYCKECLYPSLFASIVCGAILHIYDSVSKVIVLCFDIRLKKQRIYLEAGNKFGLFSKHFFMCVVFFILYINLKRQAMLIGIPEFIESISNNSELYEREYINPQDVTLLFPQEKRNLLLIYMESMESTYASKDKGGGKPYNYIPGLIELAEKNLYFSDDNDLGGAHSCSGTTWTMAGLLATSAGINYKLPINGNEAGEYQDFLKGLITIGDILESEGYRNYFMCGSDAGFAGRRDFYEQHGDYHIWDYYSAIEEGIIPENYYEFWGMEDKYLYEYAKQKLTEIAENDEVFNFTILTADTHHPEGYMCELCEDKYPEPYANAIVCADKQICNFLNWAKEQEWYENTTIVITGDHCSMVTDFWGDISGYERKIYNCFLNVSSTFSKERTRNREFSTLDMFPTILSAMGIQIEGERLGLGTNLFSNERTLPEKIGWESFDEELKLYSNYYFNHFIIGIDY